MSEIGEKIREQGYQSGIKIGVEKGEARARQNNARSMLQDGCLTVQQIAKYSGLSEENVEKLKASMKKD